MKIPSHPTLLRRMIEHRVKQLCARGPVLSASFVQIRHGCGHLRCLRCESGEKHLGNYITFPMAGKTKTVYVPLDLVQEVQAWIREHKRLKALVREISQLSVARIRGHVQARKRRGGRS